MTSAKETILVVGAGGFIGKHLVRELHQKGRRVIAVARHPLIPESPNIHYHIADLRTPEEFVTILDNCSKVVWLASVSTPGSSAGKPLDDLEGNLLPLLALLQALQNQKGIALIFISSGGTLYGDVAGGDAKEEMPLRPKSYYGAGKAAAEHFITAWSHQFNQAALIFRPSNIYGPGQTRQSGFGIIPTAFEKIIYNQPLTVWGDGETIRDYLYIDDFLSLCLKAIETPLLPGTLVLNAASGKGTRLNRLLSCIEKISAKKIERAYQHGRPVDVNRIVLNNTAAKQHYDWKPNISLNEGLSRTWKWFKTIHP